MFNPWNPPKDIAFSWTITSSPSSLVITEYGTVDPDGAVPPLNEPNIPIVYSYCWFTSITSPIVTLGVGVAVGVDDGVSVGVGVTGAVALGDAVILGVGVFVGVSVLVTVGVFVGVSVLVTVGVFV